MDPEVMLLLIVALIVLAAVGVGLAFLLPILLKQLQGGSGGWSRLAKVYTAGDEPTGTPRRLETILVGRVLYRNCVNVCIEDPGLYLSVRSPLGIVRKSWLMIPWGDFKEFEETGLQWKRAALLTIGDPRIGTLTVHWALYEKIKPRLTCISEPSEYPEVEALSQ